MGIDYYCCSNCGEPYADIVDSAVSCDSCVNRWCSTHCAEEDGAMFDDYGDCISCGNCRGESFDDSELLAFALHLLNMYESELADKYKKFKEKGEV